MRPLVVGIAAALAVGATSAQAAQTYCNRECLAGVMNSYLQALVSHDPASLPVARNIKYTENGVRLNLGDGLCQTAAAMPTYRLDVIDDEAEQVGLLGRISENGNNNWFAVRLKVDHKPADVASTFRQPITFYIAEVFKVTDGRIRQIEAVLTTVPFRMESGW